MERAAVRRTALLVSAFGVLGWFASSGPHLFDAGELVAAGFRLGGSHPPGQPLHALASSLAVLLPLGSVTYRIALVSVACAVAAAWALARLVDEVLEERASLAGDASALCFLIAPPILRQAVRVEVYALAVLLSVIAVQGLVRWSRGDSRGVKTAALFAGLASAVHPPHALAVVLCGAVVWGAHARRRLCVRAVAQSACFFGLGASVVSLLPLRAGRAPMWGDPQTLEGFWRYISAASYQQNLGAPDVLSAASVVGHAVWTAGALPLLGLFLFARGGATETPALDHGDERLDPRVLLFFPLVALGAALLQPLEVSNPDNVAYLGPALAMVIALGAAGLSRALAGKGAVAFVALAVLALNVPNVAALPDTLRGGDLPELDALALALTETPPARALVVAETDFVAAAWMVERETAGARPDVATFTYGLSTSSWHWRTLAAHPAFDGVPVRGPGTGYLAYVRGAASLASGKVPVLAETDEAFSGRGIVAGPYLLAPATASAPGAATTRWLARAATLGARGRPSDHDAARAILRDEQVRRARRLSARGETWRAAAALRQATHGAVPPELFEGASLRHAPVPTVLDPGFLVSEGDAYREAVVWLDAHGKGQDARVLLGEQVARDPRAFLQLAWLELLRDPPGARRALDAFLAAAPELTDEAALIRENL